MAFIPKEHRQYDILPASRADGREVFAYDSKLLFALEQEIGESAMPYGYHSYEAYFAYLDELSVSFPSAKEIIAKYKTSLRLMNDKSKWGIIQYLGTDNDCFTNGRCYYVPMYQENGQWIVGGIIDDGEFTDYVGFPLSKDENAEVKFEMIADPSGQLEKRKVVQKNRQNRRKADR
ncbi:MAG: hypothetical protein IJ168_02945 [Eubacterium sp.]|nr:hypothetical protein [Eubacterium sp.]